MRPFPTFLLIVAVVAVALFADHALFREAPAPPSDVPAWVEGGGHGEPTLGREAATTLAEHVKRLEAQVGAQATEIARLRAALPRPGVVDPNALRDLLGPGEGEYDENALAALETHLQELDRRRRASQQMSLVERNLDRLDLRLNDDEHAAVVDAVLAFRAKTTTFWQDMADRGITDRSRQMEEMQRLREDVIETLRKIVPDQDLARAVDGLIGPGATALPPGSSSAPGRGALESR